jgi:hypothetical protein
LWGGPRTVICIICAIRVRADGERPFGFCEEAVSLPFVFDGGLFRFSALLDADPALEEVADAGEVEEFAGGLFEEFAHHLADLRFGHGAALGGECGSFPLDGQLKGESAVGGAGTLLFALFYKGD